MDELGWVGEEGGANNARRVLARQGTFPLRIQFLDPFDPRDFPGRKAIAAESRRRIEEALVIALGGPLRPFAWSVPQVNYAGAATDAT
jgi:1-acyl-sn-glycerol-3-phosphate acyltransferase